jgi:hypothetical protein
MIAARLSLKFKPVKGPLLVVEGSFQRHGLFKKIWEKEDAKSLRPIISLNFRCTQVEGEWDDKCWLNGKFCRKILRRHLTIEQKREL